MISNFIWGKQLAKKSPFFDSFAASIAYYFLLSIVPFLVVIIGLLGYFTPVDLTSSITKVLQDLVPPESNLNIPMIVESAAGAGSGGLLTITFVFAAWSSNNFMSELARALRFIFSAEEHTPKKSLWHRLVALALVLGWGIALIFTACWIVFIPLVLDWILEAAGIPQMEVQFLHIIKITASFIILFCGILLTYQLTCRRKILFRIYLEGTFIATLGWHLIGYAFSNILPEFWANSVIYGALGSLVATLIWAYLSAWSIIIGACWISRRAS